MVDERATVSLPTSSQYLEACEEWQVGGSFQIFHPRFKI